MSFRHRLTIFFVLIVVVPTAALAIVVLRISDEAATGNADASLATALSAAESIYSGAAQLGPARIREFADRAAPALAAGDRGRLRRIADRQVKREGIAAVAFYDRSGERLVRRGREDVLGVSRLSVTSRGRQIGEIELASIVAERYLNRVTKVLPAEGLLAIADRPVASSLDLQDVRLPGPGAEPATVTALGSQLRAGAIELDPNQSATLVLLVEPGSEGLGLSRPVVIAALTALFVLALVLITYIVRLLQRQVGAMLEAAQAIGAGDFEHRVPAEGDDEMAGLAQEFNQMSDRLSDQVEQLRRQRQELERSVRRIGEAFASGLDREALLEIVVETAVDTCEADAGMALVVEGEREQRIMVGAAAEDELGIALQEAVAESEEGGSGRGRKDELSFIHQALHGTTGSEPLGALAVVSRSRELGEQEEDVLRYLAGQASVSVHNVALHEQVSAQAVTDGLTGLSNKRHFQQWIDQELERRDRFGGELSLVMLDIDNFKRINDEYGHMVGDEALRVIAGVLEEHSRDVDLPSRYGGEEFVMALPSTGKEGAREVAERVREKIAETRINGASGTQHIALTASLGVATIPDDGQNAAGLVAAADQALYEAKRAGKNRVEVA